MGMKELPVSAGPRCSWRCALLSSPLSSSPSFQVLLLQKLPTEKFCFFLISFRIKSPKIDLVGTIFHFKNKTPAKKCFNADLGPNYFFLTCSWSSATECTARPQNSGFTHGVSSSLGLPYRAGLGQGEAMLALKASY